MPRLGDVVRAVHVLCASQYVLRTGQYDIDVQKPSSDEMGGTTHHQRVLVQRLLVDGANSSNDRWPLVCGRAVGFVYLSFSLPGVVRVRQRVDDTVWVGDGCVRRVSHNPHALCKSTMALHTIVSHVSKKSVLLFGRAPFVYASCLFGLCFFFTTTSILSIFLIVKAVFLIH